MRPTTDRDERYMEQIEQAAERGECTCELYALWRHTARVDPDGQVSGKVWCVRDCELHGFLVALVAEGYFADAYLFSATPADDEHAECLDAAAEGSPSLEECHNA